MQIAAASAYFSSIIVVSYTMLAVVKSEENLRWVRTVERIQGMRLTKLVASLVRTHRDPGRARGVFGRNTL